MMRGRWSWLLAVTIGLVAAIWQRWKAHSARLGTTTGPRIHDQGNQHISSMSKADLYEEAKQLDIPGRSQMSRDELIEAIACTRPLTDTRLS